MKKILFLILSAGIVAHAQTVATNDTEETQPAKGKYPPPVYPTNVRVEANVPYLGADRAEKADLYFPLQMPNGKKLPAILVIHGGGFNDGDKARPREMNIATNLVLQNYVCMSINYKLRRKAGDVTWPQALYDAKAAVRWLRKNADRLQIVRERIGVIGCSAGGNLATMLALTQPKDGFDLSEPSGGVSSATRARAWSLRLRRLARRAAASRSRRISRAVLPGGISGGEARSGSMREERRRQPRSSRAL